MNSSSTSKLNPPYTIQASCTPPLVNTPSTTDMNIDKIAKEHLAPIQKLSAYDDMRQRVLKRVQEEKNGQKFKEQKKQHELTPDPSSKSNISPLPTKNKEVVDLDAVNILLSMSVPIKHPLSSTNTSFESLEKALLGSESLSDISFQDEIDASYSRPKTASSSSANRNKNTPILDEDPFRFDNSPFNDLKDLSGHTPFETDNTTEIIDLITGSTPINTLKPIPITAKEKKQAYRHAYYIKNQEAEKAKQRAYDQKKKENLSIRNTKNRLVLRKPEELIHASSSSSPLPTTISKAAPVAIKISYADEKAAIEVDSDSGSDLFSLSDLEDNYYSESNKKDG